MKIRLFKTIATCLSLVAMGGSTSLLGQTPVNKTPVLHLSFDNVSGSTVINSGFGGSAMNGTLNGTATIVPGGKFGSCLSISGASANSASCRVASSVVPLSVGAGNAWTVAMWIQTSTAGGCYAYQGDGGWGNHNTSFYLNSGGENPGDNAGGVRYGEGWEQGTAVVDDGNWHQLVITCNGTTKAQYVDGVLDSFTKNEWGADAIGSQFWIGGNGSANDGSVNLNGLIDEVYVFNLALSLPDIQALYNSNTAPGVPVAVAVNPVSGYRGQFVTVTATATPVVGIATNATADLSAFGLSASVNLVQSSANVFTNSFTVPGTTPIGATLVKVTVASTEPLAGSGGATFTVLPRPPTNAIVLTQLTSVSAYEYTKASFHFAATNDAPDAGTYSMIYSWYKGGQLVSSNMGPNYSFLTTPADNNVGIYAIARVASTNFSSLTVTSAVVTLTVNPGSLVYTNVLKREFFAGASRADVEIGNVGPGVVGVVTNADSPGGLGDNYTERYSGYFIPPANDSYVFFVAADDDSDVYLSPDSNPANKQLIAQETEWNGTRNWLGTGGANSIISQRRSDQWTNSLGEMPYTNGFSLLAGQKYYLEVVHHNGGGGDNVAVTYLTTNEIALDSGAPANGTVSRMTAASNNIALVTFPGSTITWSLQPHSVTVYEGASTNFTSLAISDAEMQPTYQWYMNNAPVPGATGSTFSMGTIPASYDNAQIKVVATTLIGGLSTTSSVVTLNVLQAVAETGFLKLERWNNQTTLTPLESGSLGVPDFTMAIPAFAGSIDNPSGHDNFVRRISGYFIPATNGNYVFFTTGDDDSDLFLSTDNTPANKRLVCQQAGWNTGGNWAWLQTGGGGAVASQTRSDQWTPDAGATTPWSAGIPLLAGHKYYIEQDWHQGGGGANNAATFIMVGEPDPTPGTPTRLTGSVIGMSAIRCDAVAFTQQPTNVTVSPMGYATFSADGTTDATTPIGSIYGFEEAQVGNYLFFQWYKNGVAIAGANSKTLTLGPLLPSDDNASIYCTMRALGYANNALTPIWSNSLSATITITPQAVFETGVAKINWWTNASRANVESGGAGSPQFSYTTPKFEGPTGNTTMRGYATAMNGYFIPPTNGNYVFFVNSDGDSDLFISTNSNPANKRLVAMETGWSDPFRWTTIGATWGGGGSSTAAQKRSDQFTPDGGVTYPGNPGSIGGIPMIAGQKYYMEGVHQAGGGNDHIEVTYIAAGGVDPALGSDSMLTGDLLGTYVPRIPWVAFLQQPTNQTVLSGTPVTFTVRGTNAPSVWVGTTGNPWAWMTNPPTDSLQYQWYKNGTPIAGATASSYTLPNVLPADQSAQFVCGLRALGLADNSGNRIYSNSVAAVLTVVTDTVPPTISYAATFENTNLVPTLFIVNVTFSKWMDATTLSNAANYTIVGATVTNVSVASNHRTVQLLLNQMPTLPLNITVNGVKDMSGNTIASGSTAAINAEKLNFSDVGTPGTDPAYPSHIWIAGNGGYIVSAEGSDIWNANDGCNFGWQLKTNDFDVVVRGVSVTPTSTWAKQGLMARETLDATSREWSIVNEPLAADGGANRMDTAMRTATGAASVGWQLTAGDLPPPSYPNAWLRLKRTITVTVTATNDVLDGFYSTNGVDWVHATSYTNAPDNALTNVLYVGICTTAHNNDVVSDPAPSPFLYYNTAEYANYNSSYLATGALLSVQRSGANVIVSWTGGGHLEASPAIGGAGVNWQTVSGSSPVSVPIGSGAQFFRVVNP